MKNTRLTLLYRAMGGGGSAAPADVSSAASAVGDRMLRSTLYFNEHLILKSCARTISIWWTWIWMDKSIYFLPSVSIRHTFLSPSFYLNLYAKCECEGLLAISLHWVKVSLSFTWLQDVLTDDWGVVALVPGRYACGSIAHRAPIRHSGGKRRYIVDEAKAARYFWEPPRVASVDTAPLWFRAEAAF